MKDNFKEVEIDQFKDEDVIKGLEVCSASPDTCGRNCPYYALTPGCICKLTGYAYDLINRQKAEIESLQEYYKMYFDQKIEINDKQIEIDYMQDKYSLLEENIKKLNSKAIKRFAERLKARLTTLEYTKETDKRTVSTDYFVCMMNDVLHETVPSLIDSALKETTEEVQK
mgnify:CR=1 FL=1